MTLKLAPIHYGMKEIKSLYHRYAFEGLMFSIVLHFIVLGLYFSLAPLFTSDTITINPPRPPFDWLPPPSIGDQSIPQVGNVVVPKSPVQEGQPVPVPDLEFKEEQSLPDPKDISPGAGQRDGEPGEGFGVPDGLVGVAGLPGDEVIDLTSTFRENIVLPEVARQVKPEYPEDARRLGLEGLVVVKLLINKDGRPQKAEIFSSQHEIFDENAKNAALQWLFTPAIANGYLVSVWVTVPFNFRLNR